MKDKGFTLIELLTVVAIIGVLASIALPMFSDYKKKANDVVAISNTKNMYTAFAAFEADHPDFDHTINLISIQVSPDGTVRESDYAGFSYEEILPGYIRDEKVGIRFSTGIVRGAHAEASHCRGSEMLDVWGDTVTANFEITPNSKGVTLNRDWAIAYNIDGSDCP